MSTPHEPFTARLDGEPACWSWPVPDETVRLLERARQPQGDMDRIEYATLLASAYQFYALGRCAICGGPSGNVEDHDHATGLVRGSLCSSCNSREGIHRHPGNVFDLYRQRYPYLILGVVEQYGDMGWQRGRADGHGTPDPANRWKDNAMRGAL